MSINTKLAKERGLNNIQIITLSVIQSDLLKVLDKPLEYFKSYEDAVYYLESAELVMQRLWGFEYNPNYQTYRFDFIDCTCPRLDNQERRGTGYWVYSADCPVHKHLCNNR